MRHLLNLAADGEHTQHQCVVAPPTVEDASQEIGHHGRAKLVQRPP